MLFVLPFANYARPPASSPDSLPSYQGHVSAALVLGGVDINGPSLYSIYPHGSTDKLPYVTMGSGSLAAMAVFESGYTKDMDVRILFATTTVKSI